MQDTTLCIKKSHLSAVKQTNYRTTNVTRKFSVQVIKVTLTNLLTQKNKMLKTLKNKLTVGGGGGPGSGDAGHGVVQVHARTVLAELAAVEHGRPVELVLPQDGRARPLHVPAQRPARRYGRRVLLDADGREEGAEEDAGVNVASLAEEGNEAGRLLLHLLQRFVSEEVREDHLGVADAVAQFQVFGDAHAGGVLAPVELAPVAVDAGCHDDGDQQGEV